MTRPQFGAVVRYWKSVPRPQRPVKMDVWPGELHAQLDPDRETGDYTDVRCYVCTDRTKPRDPRLGYGQNLVVRVTAQRWVYKRQLYRSELRKIDRIETLVDETGPDSYWTFERLTGLDVVARMGDLEFLALLADPNSRA